MRLLNLSADSGHSRSTIVANATAATTIVTHALLMVAAAWCSVLLNPGTLHEYTAATTMNQETAHILRFWRRHGDPAQSGGQSIAYTVAYRMFYYAMI